MQLIKQHSLVIGIVLMFALTWPFYQALGLFVGYGLAAACLIATALTQGADGVKSLLRRFLLWRVSYLWYLVVIIGPFALYAVAVALYHLLGGTSTGSNTLAPSLLGRSGNLWLWVVPFFILDAITNGEELAWRGFVLPRFQTRFNALASSVITGAIWGL
jgi:uncharacterized protein